MPLILLNAWVRKFCVCLSAATAASMALNCLVSVAEYVLRRNRRADCRLVTSLSPLRNPILDDMFSPYGNLAWFSKVMAQGGNSGSHRHLSSLPIC